MPAARQQRGAAVEAAARAQLEQAGLRLVAGNANYRGGELDLVMRDGPMLVFVEVRYRRDARFDVVEASGEPPLLHWIRDAFRLDDC